MMDNIKNTLSSKPENDPKTDVQNFDLQSAIEKIKSEDAWKSGGRNSSTLLKSPEMSIILMAMHGDTEIGAHQANGRISVQVIAGELKFNTENESIILKKDGLLTLKKNIIHSLKAIEDTFFLLTKVNV